MQWRFTPLVRNHGVPEGGRIPSLKIRRKALEQERGFPGVFSDCSD